MTWYGLAPVRSHGATACTRCRASSAATRTAASEEDPVEDPSDDPEDAPEADGDACSAPALGAAAAT
ncbi:hypothetical protein [Streptacidiphilus jeojiense]|uniref:hypothetical protein n=1 Tax=Streptacidiphilus jeojiense TaxID=436229 RepID=UPI0004BEE11E|nr:hypothetical protein [Streptacidiphilus jeojiense]